MKIRVHQPKQHGDLIDVFVESDMSWITSECQHLCDTYSETQRTYEGDIVTDTFCSNCGEWREGKQWLWT